MPAPSAGRARHRVLPPPALSGGEASRPSASRSTIRWRVRMPDGAIPAGRVGGGIRRAGPAICNKLNRIKRPNTRGRPVRSNVPANGPLPSVAFGRHPRRRRRNHRRPSGGASKALVTFAKVDGVRGVAWTLCVTTILAGQCAGRRPARPMPEQGLRQWSWPLFSYG